MIIFGIITKAMQTDLNFQTIISMFRTQLGVKSDKKKKCDIVSDKINVLVLVWRIFFAKKSIMMNPLTIKPNIPIIITIIMADSSTTGGN